LIGAGLVGVAGASAGTPADQAHLLRRHRRAIRRLRRDRVQCDADGRAGSYAFQSYARVMYSSTNSTASRTLTAQ